MLFNFEGMLPAKRGVTFQMGGAIQKFSIRGTKGASGEGALGLFNILVYGC